MAWSFGLNGSADSAGRAPRRAFTPMDDGKRTTDRQAAFSFPVAAVSACTCAANDEKNNNTDNATVCKIVAIHHPCFPNKPGK